MAALQCEICGGKLMAKSGGIFECDSCGMQYDKTRVQEMVQEIKGTVKIEGPVEVTGTVKVEGGANVDSLLKRGNIALEDRQWDKAKELFEQVLSMDSESAEAYLGLTMARWKTADRTAFEARYIDEEIPNNDKNFERARQFAGAQLSSWIEDLAAKREAAEKKRRAAVREKQEQLALVSRIVSSGETHTVGLKPNGAVVATGSNAGNKSNVSGWRDIVAVAAGVEHTVGLKSDGTVVAAGSNSGGRCDVSGWQDIVALDIGYYHTVGLKANGTVVATGINKNYQCNVIGWWDIAAIAAGNFLTVGLRANGTVVVAFNYSEKYDVSNWRDIVAIAAGDWHIVGLKSDGTVVAAGESENPHGQCDVSGWRDIVAVAAGKNHTVGLKSDGTVVAVGDNQHGQRDVSSWRDIVAVTAGFYQTIGLKADGTVLAVGKNNKGQCNVQGWKLFNSIDTLEQERAGAKETLQCGQGAGRQQKIAALEAQRQTLQTEIANCKGLFSGGKRRELEARLAQVEKELSEL